VVEQMLPVLVSAAHTVQRVLQQGQEQQEFKVNLQLVVTCHRTCRPRALHLKPPPPPSH
jgi:hypothetical protein